MKADHCQTAKTCAASPDSAKNGTDGTIYCTSAWGCRVEAPGRANARARLGSKARDANVEVTRTARP